MSFDDPVGILFQLFSIINCLVFYKRVCLCYVMKVTLCSAKQWIIFFHSIQKCCHFSVAMSNIVLACRHKKDNGSELSIKLLLKILSVVAKQNFPLEMLYFDAIVFGFFYTSVSILWSCSDRIRISVSSDEIEW